MKILAIDPGSVSGAYAIFHGNGSITVGDLPVVDRQVDPAMLTRIVRTFNPDCAVVERVGAMPGQGVSSTFKFGFAAGCIQGVLTAWGVPTRLVAPTVWKKELSLPGKDKEAARALAIRLYPGVEGLDLKKHQNRAEALLLGHWFFLQGAAKFVRALRGETEGTEE